LRPLSNERNELDPTCCSQLLSLSGAHAQYDERQDRLGEGGQGHNHLAAIDVMVSFLPAFSPLFFPRRVMEALVCV
jgi:hypothetical protein